MAVLNLMKEGNNDNKTFLCLETGPSLFARENFQNITFEPCISKQRKTDSLDTKKNPRKEKTTVIYVWNLSPYVSEDSFRQTFEAFGQVSTTIISSTILNDRENGQLRRFAFVEMPHQAEARAAIRTLNRKVLLGRQKILYGSSEN